MKQSEFKPCAICGEGMLHHEEGRVRTLNFFRVKIEYFMALPASINRQHGREQSMMPMPELAQTMGPDEDLATELSAVEALVCLHCGMKATLGQIKEMAAEV